MERKNQNIKLSNKQTEIEAKNDPIGYPLYPNKDDIYNRWKEEVDIDPEDVSKMKEVIDEDEIDIKEELDEGTFGGDLDIPGAELDDEQENIGSEDEENNYYSIGSDNHNNLEEHNRN